MSIHIEGFEQFLGETSGLNSSLVRADYVANGPWAIVAGRMPNSYGVAGRVTSMMRRFPWALDKPTLTFGFSHMFDARGSVAHIKVGAANLYFWIHPDTGIPMLNQSAGGSLPTKLRWYYFEIEIDRVSGDVRLYINGRLDGNANIGAIQLVTEAECLLGYVLPSLYRPGVTPVPTDNAAKTYDDMYIRDSTRLGPISVSTRIPTHDEAIEWIRADPTEAHNESVSHRPPKPLDSYVASDTIGTDESFSSSEPLANANPVIISGLVVLARKSDLLNAKLGAFVSGAGVDPKSATRPVTSAWRTQYICFDHTSDDSASAMLASTFGITVAAP